MKVNKEQMLQNRAYLKSLIRSQRDNIAAKEGEMEQVSKLYDQKIDAHNLANEKRLIDIHDRNKVQLLDAYENQEGKLNEIKKSLIDTQERIRRERENLNNQNQGQLENIKNNHQDKAIDLIDRSRAEMMDLNDNLNNRIKKSQFDTQQTITEIENQNRLNIDKATFESGLKASLGKSDQAKNLRDSETRFRQTLHQREGEHKNRLAQEHFKNQMEFKTRKRIQEDRHMALEKHYQELLVGEKQAFEHKYAAAVKQHQSVLQELNGKLKDQMQETVRSLAKEKMNIQVKKNDPFYNLTSLDSNIREDEKFYYLDIPTPEHEKDNYHVTTNNRSIKIRFSRSSEERLDDEKGNVQQSHRSEGLSKEFNVDKILDAKKIKTAYNDGVLTFKIGKA